MAEAGEKYFIWDAMANQTEHKLEFLNIINGIYLKGSEQEKKLVFELKEGFDFRARIMAIMDKKYQYLLNSCQCMMVSGWEKEK